jgi:hypothetical protein
MLEDIPATRKDLLPRGQDELSLQYSWVDRYLMGIIGHAVGPGF